MPTPNRHRQPRSLARADAVQPFGPAAIGLAGWLAMMVMMRFVQIMPASAAGAAMAAGQIWTRAAWGG